MKYIIIVKDVFKTKDKDEREEKILNIIKKQVNNQN